MINIKQKTMKTIAELLELIDGVKTVSKKELFNLNQPEEWIKSKKSLLNETEYQYNDIELIEGLMDMMFIDWYYEIKHSPLIIQDKNGGAAVTVTVNLSYLASGEQSYSTRSGIATEYVSSIKMLPLATPKVASMSFKNAVKKLGRLFGGSLNRNLEEATLPDVTIEKEAPDRMYKRYKMLIDDSKTEEELLTYQFVIPESLKKIYQEKKSFLAKNK